MYQNSVRVRGHAKKRLHRRKLTQRYLNCPFPGYPFFHYKSWRDYLARCDDFGGHEPCLEYWGRCDLSKERKAAKKRTNRILRTGFRSRVRYEDPEELPVSHHAKYRRSYNYGYWVYW